MQLRWNDNSVAFFNQWLYILHLNHCKDNDQKKICICHEGAFKLTEERLKSISKGMPDYHPDVHQLIMRRAFEIHRIDCSHKDHKNWTMSLMSSYWCEKDGCPQCNCYDEAELEYQKGLLIQHLEVTTQIEEFSDTYERIV